MKNTQSLKNPLFLFLLVLILVSCNNSKKEQPKEKDEKNNTETVFKYILDEKFLGNWIAFSMNQMPELLHNENTVMIM